MHIANTIDSLGKVSVIIPTFNRAIYLEKAIQSILGQTYKNVEIIVVDDGSTDDTTSVIERYKDQVVYHYIENSGVSAARNTGIKLATGEWIAFLDSDDEWTEDYLSYQMERVKIVPDACMHYMNSYQISKTGVKKNTFLDLKLMNYFKNNECVVIKRPLIFIINHHITNLQATIMRRKQLNLAGLFDEELTILEDLDMIARMAMQGPFSISSKNFVNIYRREEKISNLTAQIYKYPIFTENVFTYVYDKLNKNDRLDIKERMCLSYESARRKRAMANLLLLRGDVADARSFYLRSFSTCPSFKTIGRYLLSFFPHNLAIKFHKYK